MNPVARREDLLVREIDDELIVYDRRRDRAHRLNATAALVWSRCDGRTDVAQLAAQLSERTGLPTDTDLVRLALLDLETAELLEAGLDRGAAPMSRRDVVARIGRTAALMALIPAVHSIAAPTPARATTGGGDSSPSWSD